MRKSEQREKSSSRESGADHSPLYTLSVIVLTAILTMLSGWLKNLMASVYRAKSLVCWKHGRQRARTSTPGRIRSERGELHHTKSSPSSITHTFVSSNPGVSNLSHGGRWVWVQGFSFNQLIIIRVKGGMRSLL